MALSTLSRAMRPCLFSQRSALALARPSMPMASSANDQMEEYWERNQRLNRPNSPWLIYKWPLTMLSSFTHRVSGVGLGLGLYGASVGLALSPVEFSVILDAIKSWELGPAVWFPVKSACAFLVTYKCLSGSRHLFWDFKSGYEIRSQNMSAYFIWGTSLVAGLTIAAAPYFM